MSRKLIVTHHAPDLDAVGAVWLLKRFDTQHYADAKLAFVNPGDTIKLEEAEEHGCQLHEVTHVDTGLGEFDHHQPERGHQYISATSLVHDHVCQLHPDLEDDAALQELVAFVTETDHFGEVNWPDANSSRYCFMVHELLRGSEFTELHDDTAQLHFGMQCLDYVYSALKQHVKAKHILATEGTEFELSIGKCLGVETRNDEVIKLAQKTGFALVVRKDPEGGHIRIKARPDAAIDLKAVATAIAKVDTKGTWYYHPSGKMLINGSRKHRNQTASPLTLAAIIELLKTTYQ